ncbi:MAG: TIGR02996 domain-containing protein, partial [Gemmataceae bacterium]|nr:TIGR02996 domain-containing protein [Gemmataceae bacterium]
MTDERALLRAICADPDEDTPRLAYADFLDEHGRHDRAAFVRGQVELATLQEDSYRIVLMANPLQSRGGSAMTRIPVRP